MEHFDIVIFFTWYLQLNSSRQLTLKASVVAFTALVEDLDGSSSKTKAECYKE